MKSFSKKNKNKGFTIFELLITIAVLAVIIFLLAINIPPQMKKAKDAKRKADLEKIKISLYDYFFDKDCFSSTLPSCQENLKLGDNIYLSNFPCDPKGSEYVYQKEDKECPQWFKIFTNLENIQDMSIDKVGCRSGCGPECQYNYGLSSSNISLNEGCTAMATYACTPNGRCIEYEDAQVSRCPLVFEKDSSCQNICSKKANRCHDERGKKNPGE